MITVIELLSHPIFSNFTLATDTSGLYRRVTGTGIFDWETKENVSESFNEGEFIVATFSSAKDNPTYLEGLIKALILNKVSAIAIKDVCHKKLSDNIINFANSKHVPIFFFSDTFFDDIIFTIKNRLNLDNINIMMTEKIDEIIKSDMEAVNITGLLKDINPFFHNNLICGFCTLMEGSELKITRSTLLDPAEKAYSIIRYNQGVFIIYTSMNDSQHLREDILDLINKLGLKDSKIKIGISTSKTILADAKKALKESYFANISCNIDGENLLDFNQTGIDQFLAPLRNNEWIIYVYNSYLQTITSYDDDHNTNLMETLLKYIICSGDIKLTANLLHQNDNTIRYRLKKIKELLKIQESSDAYCQLYFFARLYQINQIADKNLDK